ncbi:hypothetical protein [Terrabacter sp. NPDC080008]|uniref:hypothetical protein n=1 Tax=Terrabacter sp. NPDC080008 TaxID=3155176 RepID=UPI00344BD276
MTTTTRPDAVLAPEPDVTAPARPTADTISEKQRRWVVPVVVGAVAFATGAAIGSSLTWRFSIWWKPL